MFSLISAAIDIIAKGISAYADATAKTDLESAVSRTAEKTEKDSKIIHEGCDEDTINLMFNK